MSKYGDKYDNEKKLQRALKQEAEKASQRDLFLHYLAPILWLDDFLYKREEKIYVQAEDWTKITNLQRVLIQFGYTWVGDGDNKVRHRQSRLWFRPEKRIMNIAGPHETLSWRDPESIRVDEIIHLEAPQPSLMEKLSSKAKDEIKVRERDAMTVFIDSAIQDRVIWRKRRADQIRDLIDVKKKAQSCTSRREWEKLWETAQEIRGSYAASKQ